MNTDPVVVNYNVLPDLLRSGLRYLIVLLSGFGVLSNLLTEEQIEFIRSEEFLAALSAIAAAVAYIWGQISVYRRRVLLRSAALSAKSNDFVVDNVSTVKDLTTPSIQ